MSTSRLSLHASMANIPIERATTARFLGVLVDSNLTWKQHITALHVKMARNSSILFKLKGILPLDVLKTLYHSFVQSHLNHCPLIWGLGNKSTLAPLFTAQKRAVRTLAPGFVNYFYNKETGEHPHHTKQVFAITPHSYCSQSSTSASTLLHAQAAKQMLTISHFKSVQFCLSKSCKQ